MEKTLELFSQIFMDLLEDEKTKSVSSYIPSSELFNTLDLSLAKAPMSEVDFEKVIRELVFATTRTATSGFFNQLYGGRNEKAILGDLLAVMLNNSMYTYKAAGAQIGVEATVLRNVCDIIGWDENSGGTFAAGGSMTNFMSMLMARDRVVSDARNVGLSDKLTVYTSEVSHYSIPKNAAFCGIGRDNVRYVKADKFGKLKLDSLKELIEEDLVNGFKPTLLNLTAGTTVLGAFDSIKDFIDICKKHNIWVHLDGAYCGSVLFSEKYKHLIDGVELVDSFSFNAHKMIGTPLSCSLILVRDKVHLYDSFSNDASYLYQTDHDDFNLGKTSLQCGRRNDALKFWTLWRSVGTIGLEAIIDVQFNLADVAREYIRNNSDYTLYSYDDSISICFNYKDISPVALCTLLYEHSTLLVGYGSHENVEFIRFVTINAQNNPQDILNFFATLEQFVEENVALFPSLKDQITG